jgi:ribulose 1,5-bisphosphate synthetase/thiazole synthase
VSVFAGDAAATGAANTAFIDRQAPAGLVAAAVAAQQPSKAVNVNAGHASGVGLALTPTTENGELANVGYVTSVAFAGAAPTDVVIVGAGPATVTIGGR